MINITPAADLQIQKNLNEAQAKALRVSVKKSGCSGYKYFLDFATEILDTDEIIKDGALIVIANKEILPMLENITLDYINQGLNRSFKFSNPNATAECGCGESFSFAKPQ
ncbi:FeS cluster assembly protein [Gammaproteobacteria bacterium]|nr:FeS cluster assembly protein [Gammaproteobacteria bacterium]